MTLANYGGPKRGHPPTRTVNRQAQRELAAQAAKMGPAVLKFFEDVFMGRGEFKDIHPAYRIECGKELLNRGYGRPGIQMEVDVQAEQITKVIHEVRWLPPDPNDTSVVIEPTDGMT